MNHIYKSVPCNGCTLCCQNDAVRLLPGDDPAEYKTEPHPYLHGALMLAHKPDGSCIYLVGTGCTIHGRAPVMCQEMDCRELAAAFTFTNARKLDEKGALTIRIWRRGKELLKGVN